MRWILVMWGAIKAQKRRLRPDGLCDASHRFVMTIGNLQKTHSLPAHSNQRHILGVAASYKAGEIAGHQNENVKIAAMVGDDSPCRSQQSLYMSVVRSSNQGRRLSIEIWKIVRNLERPWDMAIDDIHQSNLKEAESVLLVGMSWQGCKNLKQRLKEVSDPKTDVLELVAGNLTLLESGCSSCKLMSMPLQW